MNKNFWGQSYHLDLHNCNVNKFSKVNLNRFCKELCQEIEMKRHGKTMVERFGAGKLLGNSALQFIETSSISVHADEFFNRIFIDIFSCKRFNCKKAKSFCMIFFESRNVKSRNLYRF